MNSPVLRGSLEAHVRLFMGYKPVRLLVDANIIFVQSDIYSCDH